MGIFFPFVLWRTWIPRPTRNFFLIHPPGPPFLLNPALIISIFHATKQTTIFIFLAKQALQKKGLPKNRDGLYF